MSSIDQLIGHQSYKAFFFSFMVPFAMCFEVLSFPFIARFLLENH
jgi:hypothetical protein